MGRSEVIPNYSFFPPFSLSCAALLAITQQHILKKFIRAVKDTDTHTLPPPSCGSVAVAGMEEVL